MKSTRMTCAAAALVLAAGAAAETNPSSDDGQNPQAGSSGFSIEWHTIDAGGTLFASGGGWIMAGTVGQFDATESEALSGGGWALTGGFWAGVQGAGSEPAIFRDRFEQ